MSDWYRLDRGILVPSTCLSQMWNDRGHEVCVFGLGFFVRPGSRICVEFEGKGENGEPLRLAV
jgi:hypothetical protein